ncbi:MAG: dockerin type I domain-containing protein [Planctomycetota bacterium]
MPHSNDRNDEQTSAASRLRALRRQLVRATSRSRGRKRRLLFENLGHRRVLAVIAGTVFGDADASLSVGPDEQGLEGRLAFLDVNQNSQLDAGEPTATTNASGQFQFENVEPGIHSVRLFDGTSTQNQTLPLAPQDSLLPLAWTEATDANVEAGILKLLSENSLVQLPLQSRQTPSEHPLDFDAKSLLGSIGDATLVAGEQLDGGQPRWGLWSVVGDESIRVYTDPVFQPESTLAGSIGSDGNGLVVTTGRDGGIIYAIRADQSSPSGVQVLPTSVTVPAEAQVIGSVSGADTTLASRSLIAWPESDALEVSLWSNSASQLIGGSQATIEGATELLSFDEASGLVAVRFSSDAIGVLDVDANFAELYRFDHADQAALVPGTEFLARLVADDLGHHLTLNRLTDGEAVVDAAIDLSAVGEPLSLHTSNSEDQSLPEFVVVGSHGAKRVQMTGAGGIAVEVTDEQPVTGLEFGVQVVGSNQPPAVSGSVNENAMEDEDWSFSPEQVDQLVADADGDQAVAFISQQPSHGSVSVNETGGITYQPDANYSGVDRFRVAFSDGQSISEAVEFVITVAGTPDPPTAINFLGGELPENVSGPYEIGEIFVQDADGDDDYGFVVSDSRFTVRDGMLTLEGDSINFEVEPEVELTINGYDVAAGVFLTHTFVVRVRDQNDPITDVIAYGYGVTENVPGGIVAELDYVDEDGGDIVNFSVDDDRFVVIGNQLLLRPDQTLDYESENLVVMNVTAVDTTGTSQSTELQLAVNDVAEPVASVGLTGESVEELEYGAPVGTVLVDGLPVGDSYSVSVDDPRFEIVDSELKLVDDEYVRREFEPEIELSLTARDVGGVFEARTQRFFIRVAANDNPFHNDENPYDVNNDESVSPQDALVVINYINYYGLGPVGHGLPNYGYDVNGDGQVTTLDALLIINYLNTQQTGGGIVGTEDPSVEKETVAGGPAGEGEGSATSGSGLTLDSDAEGEFVGSDRSAHFARTGNDSPLRDDDDEQGPTFF